MKPASLLRWYPRAWRERYGEELLALIQDTLDGGRPTWRLRLGVAWGGMRERAHQVRRAVRASARPDGWPVVLLAGLLCPSLAENLAQQPSAAWDGGVRRPTTRCWRSPP